MKHQSTLPVTTSTLVFENENNTTNRKRVLGKLSFVLASVFVLASCAKDDLDAPPAPTAEEYHWNYENSGDWASHYPECAGMQQSPINIIPSQTVKTQVSPIVFDYKPFAMSIVDNGHTVQVNVPAGHASIMYNGEKYELKQFHFHQHSEHQIDGEAAPMEVHLCTKMQQESSLY